VGLLFSLELIRGDIVRFPFIAGSDETSLDVRFAAPQYHW
jgi:hypothetical protein